MYIYIDKVKAYMCVTKGAFLQLGGVSHTLWVLLCNVSLGCEIVEYEAPKPIIGIHRYVFTLFKQQCPLMVMPPIHRHNFSVRHFANICDLGLPVAAVYFNAQKQAGGRRR